MRNGYGFVECDESRHDFGADVFIHKSLVPLPFRIGQPCEFAVFINDRRQPQAIDVKWLPCLPPSTSTTLTSVPPGIPPAGLVAASSSSAGVASSSTVATASMKARPVSPSIVGANASVPAKTKGVDDEAGRDQRDVPKLGTLKSYSLAQGYGFIVCDEIRQEHNRDVYLDKSQVGSMVSWCIGMTLEFIVVYNSSGLPQASAINWDPVPHFLLPTADSHAKKGTARRDHSSTTIASLKDLMTAIANNQRSSAVIKAIELQGTGPSPTPGAPGNGDTNNNANGATEQDVDYVAFTLDRLGPERDAAGALKDLVKMLLLLMISKLFKRWMLRERRDKYVTWFEVLVDTINPRSEGVPQHFTDVVQQIEGHIHALSDHNMTEARDDLRIPALLGIVGVLKRKAEELC